MTGPVPDAVALRLRIRFTKHGKVRFISHRDVARIWERTLRRAAVPVAYSAGFTPRPRLSFGLALSTGYSSDAEYLDVDLAVGRGSGVVVDLAAESGTDVDVENLADALTAALPEGMAAAAVAFVPRSEPSLQHAVTSCTWRIDATGADAARLSRSVSRALAGDELLAERERKGRMTTENIRPAVVAVDVEGNTADGVRLMAELGTQPRAVRPLEFLASLDCPLHLQRVCRLHQWIATDSGRREPLAAAELSVAGAGGSQ